MEAIIRQDRPLRLTAICALLLLLFMCSITVVSAYDFSGGYSSAKVLGVSGGNILTIGGSSGSSLDIGMEGEAIPTSPSSPSTAGTILINLVSTLIAAGIILFAFRTGDPRVMLVGIIIGIMAFIIVRQLLG